MNIFDKLKTIFEGKFSNVFNNNTIKIFDFTKNTSQILELKKNGEILGLDLSKANEDEKKALKGIIDYAIQESDETFFSK